MAEIAERTRYFERYVTFIDAIVAIAITLLVLPLVELTSDHHAPRQNCCAITLRSSTRSP